MAFLTVVSFICLLLITTVISELPLHHEKFKVETAQLDGDDGSGLRITDPFTEDRTIQNDDEDTDEPIRNVGSLVPVDFSEELVTVVSSNILSKGTDNATISSGSKKWTSQDENSLLDFDRTKSDDDSNTPLEGAATQEPPFKNLMEINSEDLPSYVTEKGGRKYLDISSVNMTELKLGNLKDVYGISAENGQRCKIRKLIIANNYHMDRNILECHTLTNLTLTGSSWICRKDWSWLKDLEGRGISLHLEAFCEDIRKPGLMKYSRFIPLPFQEGVAALENLGIRDCPEKCWRCVAILTKEKMLDYYRVNCENSSLTDDDVPSIPTYTTQLFLERNKLRSTQKVFSHLEHLENLTTVLLDGNNLDAIPFLEEKAFKKLNRLSLTANDIRKVDVKAFKSIVDREDIVIFLQDNHFPCDCTSHFLLKLCLRNVTKANHITTWPLLCVNQSNNVRQLLTLRDECEPQISDPRDLFMPLLLIFLSIMNLIFIYLVYDLVMAIREGRHQRSKIRDPMLHQLVKGTQRFVRCVFKNRREVERETVVDVGGLRSQDTPVTLRTNRLSSVDRETSTVRTDRRRLTPCPN